MNTSIKLCALMVAAWCGAALAADAPKNDTRSPSDVVAHRNIEYVPNGGKSQSLDLYLPAKADKPLPLVVYIHGGGWQAGSKEGCWALPEVKRGYAAASLNYRLSQEAIFPAQIQDCQAAIRWLRANAKKYNINPDKIGVWGDSAGGHLSALLGTAGGKKAFPPIGENRNESDRVQAVCDWYGPTDFLNFASQMPADDGLHPNSPNSPLSKLFGGPVAEHKALALSAGPLHYVDKNCPPFLIEHVTGDNIVPIAQSEELADALKKAGVEVTLIKFEGKGHGVGMRSKPDWMDPISAFFDKELKD
ncbi:MAG TPA: alpha/beta hydrolase [Pirellulales bacterium]|jgi:acetyl esterase/lipase|nr:alpha/beta hydrolase [Pirellulales bacterium]